jgi:hypothetical protein
MGQVMVWAMREPDHVRSHPTLVGLWAGEVLDWTTGERTLEYLLDPDRTELHGALARARETKAKRHSASAESLVYPEGEQ